MNTCIDVQRTSDKRMQTTINTCGYIHICAICYGVCVYMYQQTTPSAYSAPSERVSLSATILRARSNAGHLTTVSSRMDRLHVDIWHIRVTLPDLYALLSPYTLPLLVTTRVLTLQLIEIAMACSLHSRQSLPFICFGSMIC